MYADTKLNHFCKQEWFFIVLNPIYIHLKNNFRNQAPLFRHLAMSPCY